MADLPYNSEVLLYKGEIKLIIKLIYKPDLLNN